MVMGSVEVVKKVTGGGNGNSRRLFLFDGTFQALRSTPTQPRSTREDLNNTYLIKDPSSYPIAAGDAANACIAFDLLLNPSSIIIVKSGSSGLHPTAHRSQRLSSPGKDHHWPQAKRGMLLPIHYGNLHG